MTGIKQKFVSLNLSNVYPSVKIADGTQSPVLGNGVVQGTPSLTLTDVLYAPKFPVSLLSNIITVKLPFTFSLCISRPATGKIDSGHEREGIYYLDDRVNHTSLVAY